MTILVNYQSVTAVFKNQVDHSVVMLRIDNPVNTQRINNKDAHRFNDSGAPRLGNVWVYGREMVSETVS